MIRFIARSPAPAFCFGISNDKKMLKKGRCGGRFCRSSGFYLLVEEEIGDFVVLYCGLAAW